MEGFVWALVIFGAIRLGRRQAEDTFLDYDAIRVSQRFLFTSMHQGQRDTRFRRFGGPYLGPCTAVLLTLI